MFFFNIYLKMYPGQIKKEKMNKILSEEMTRMAQLINHGKDNQALTTKNPNKNKNQLKESDLINFLGDLDIEEPQEKKTKNLPFQLKVAILAYNINEYDKELYNLYTKYSPKTKDIKQGDNDAISDRSGKPKMSRTDFEEFKKMTGRGRYPVPFSEEYEELTPEEKSEKARWLRKKDYNIIPYHAAEGSISSKGRQVLNFLGRTLANHPKDEREKVLFDSVASDAYRNNAKGILLSFYSKVLPNIIKQKTHKTNLSPEDEIIIEDGIFKAINAVESGKFDERKGDLGSYIIQIVKNSFYDYLRKVAPYQLDNPSRLFDELESRKTSDKEGLIRIKSRFKPEEYEEDKKEDGLRNVVDTIIIPPSKNYKRGLVEYVYDDVGKAVEDFTRKVKHLRPYTMPGFEATKFFAGTRKGGEVWHGIEGLEKITPSYEFSPDSEEIIDVLGEKKLELPEDAEKEIKALLQFVVDAMQESAATRKDKVKKEIENAERQLNTIRGSGTPEESHLEEKIKNLKLDFSRKFFSGAVPNKFSKKILTDFLYGYLQNPGVSTKYRDAFNAETLKQYKEKLTPEKLEGKTDEQLAKELNDMNVWISTKDDKFASEAKDYLKRFFSEPVPVNPSKLDDLFLVKKFNNVQQKLLNREQIFDIIKYLSKTTGIPDSTTKRFDENKNNLQRIIREIVKKTLN